MGKEALKSLLNWLNQDLKLNLSQKDIISNDNIKSSEVADEIRIVLEHLKSKVFEAPSLESSQTSTQKADDGSQANVENID